MADTPTTTPEPVDVASVQKPKLTAAELTALLMECDDVDAQTKKDYQKAEVKRQNRKLESDREAYQLGITELLNGQKAELLEFLPKGVVFEIGADPARADELVVTYKTRRGMQSLKGTANLKRGTRAFSYVDENGETVTLTATSWNKLAAKVATLMSEAEIIRFPKFAEVVTSGVNMKTQLEKLLSEGIFEGTIDPDYSPVESSPEGETPEEEAVEMDAPEAPEVE